MRPEAAVSCEHRHRAILEDGYQWCLRCGLFVAPEPDPGPLRAKLGEWWEYLTAPRLSLVALALIIMGIAVVSGARS